jgi:hypothetical protein
VYGVKMIKELIKLANELDEAGKSGWADKVDSIIRSLSSEEQITTEQIASTMMEKSLTNGRARLGTTGFNNPVVLIGYTGNEGGIPGNAGDTTVKSKDSVQKAIDHLGLTNKVTISGVEQDVITGMALGLVGDSKPPQPKPASYQVDIVSLTFAE